MRKILSADIGGTNSRFARFITEPEVGLSLRQTMWLKTKDSSSFGDLLEQLRATDFPLKPEDADIVVVAVAGPVFGATYSAPPFIGWDIDIANAEKDFGIKRCLLINDFVAQAYACRTRPGKKSEEILKGTVVPDAAIAVIGAGTGLGKAALVPDGKGEYVALPSEGGHTNFPFVTVRECEYQEFLYREVGDAYMTGNVVVSGRGLSYLHRFLTSEDLSPDKITTKFTGESETIQWASRFYGRVCRNFALETVARGGLYIAGGVAARAPILVKHQAFREEFRSSPEHTTLLADIPVFLMNDEQSGLWGAAYMGLLELEKEMNP